MTEIVTGYSKTYTLSEYMETDLTKELMRLYYLWIKDNNTPNIKIRIGIEVAEELK